MMKTETITAAPLSVKEAISAANKVAADVAKVELSDLPSIPVCKTCCYFVDDTKDKRAGECKYFPPVPVNNSALCSGTSFPFVLSDNWCGQWRKRKV
jgi:hypothetical protein